MRKTASRDAKEIWRWIGGEIAGRSETKTAGGIRAVASFELFSRRMRRRWQRSAPKCPSLYTTVQDDTTNTREIDCGFA